MSPALFRDVSSPQALVKEADQLAKHGVRVRVLGNTSLLPAVGNSGYDQI